MLCLPDLRPGPGGGSSEFAGVPSGGHVRIGMEDSLVYQRGEPVQSNAQLVKRIVHIAHDLGRRIATAEEARQMLGID